MQRDTQGYLQSNVKSHCRKGPVQAKTCIAMRKGVSPCDMMPMPVCNVEKHKQSIISCRAVQACVLFQAARVQSFGFDVAASDHTLYGSEGKLAPRILARECFRSRQL